MKYVAFVFARGGSKGVPGKNLREVAGKTLLQRAIDTALATPEISRVVVSTDSEEIARAAVRHGAEVPFIRPAELATDESPELLCGVMPCENWRFSKENSPRRWFLCQPLHRYDCLKTCPVASKFSNQNQQT